MSTKRGSILRGYSILGFYRVIEGAVEFLKRKNLSLPLKVETDQFVICLVLPECLSAKFAAFHPRPGRQIVTALMPSLLFRCFSLFLPHLNTERAYKWKLSGSARQPEIGILCLDWLIHPGVSYSREI